MQFVTCRKYKVMKESRVCVMPWARLIKADNSLKENSSRNKRKSSNYSAYI